MIQRGLPFIATGALIAAAVGVVFAGGRDSSLPSTDRCEAIEGDIGPARSIAPGGTHMMSTQGTIHDRYLGLGGLGAFSWSPDGQGLAYVVERQVLTGADNFLPTDPSQFVHSHLFVQAIDTSDGRSLLPPRPGGNPYWSPDGRWLAYQAPRREGEEDVICLASLEDSEQVVAIAFGFLLPRTDAHLPAERPAWSSDSNHLLLLDGDRHPYALTVGSLAGPVRLWDEPVSATSWSPDGTIIAVLGTSDPETYLPSIWIVDPEGNGEAMQIGLGRQLIWTPDSQSVITSRHPEQRVDMIDVTSGESRRLVDGALPALSPDGRELVYASRWGFGDEPVHLFVLNFVTGETTQLIQVDASFIEVPIWSPDGIQVAFYAGGGELVNGLYKVALDSPESLRLVHNAEGHHVWRPTWSPDSINIVFALGGGHD